MQKETVAAMSQAFHDLTLPSPTRKGVNIDVHRLKNPVLFSGTVNSPTSFARWETNHHNKQNKEVVP